MESSTVGWLGIIFLALKALDSLLILITLLPSHCSLKPASASYCHYNPEWLFWIEQKKALYTYYL
jgi:hypothetical protein